MAIDPSWKSFLVYLRIVVNKEAWIMDYLVDEGGGIHWNVIFCHSFNDWEMEMVLYFFHELYECKISLQENDTLMWCNDPKGSFSVKSFYSSLSSDMGIFLLAKNIWIPWVPPKVAFFAWVASHNKCLTIDNLVKMRWELPNRCIMCREAAESVDHLFIHCGVARCL